MQRILFVEGDHDWLRRYRDELPQLDFRGAVTLEEAEDFWRNDGPFDCIVVCGFLPGRASSTVPFVQKVRAEGFGGPIIAASNSCHTRDELLEAGCSHAVPNMKADTSALVQQVLGI